MYKSKDAQAAFARRPEQLLKAASRTRERRERTRQWLRDYKAQRGCILCRESHPACLQFHHRNPSEKSFEIGGAKTHSLDKIKTEIAKCDIVCANCHAKEHERLRHGTS